RDARIPQAQTRKRSRLIQQKLSQKKWMGEIPSTSKKAGQEMNDTQKVGVLVRFRNAVIDLVNGSGEASFRRNRDAAEELLRLTLGHEPTDADRDELFSDRRR